MKDNYSGRKLKLFRKNMGLTQADLADKANVNINTLAKWERNEQCPSIDNARILVRSFRTTSPKASDWEFALFGLSLRLICDVG